jgi:hypothetical protein
MASTAPIASSAKVSRFPRQLRTMSNFISQRITNGSWNSTRSTQTNFKLQAQESTKNERAILAYRLSITDLKEFLREKFEHKGIDLEKVRRVRYAQIIVCAGACADRFSRRA